MIIMKDQYKELIQKQIDKLSSKDFELDAWKRSTLIILEKIFGPKDIRLQSIRELHYDYGSWSLRDTTGGNMTKEACLKAGKAVLETAIDEIEIFGIPELADMQQNSTADNIKRLIEEELRGSEYRDIITYVKENDMKEDKNITQLRILIKELGDEVSIDILASILTLEDIKVVLIK